MTTFQSTDATTLGLAVALLLLGAVLVIVVVAWRNLPAPPVRPVEKVDPTHPHRFIDHRDDAQRAADQAATNTALGLQ